MRPAPKGGCGALERAVYEQAPAVSVRPAPKGRVRSVFRAMAFNDLKSRRDPPRTAGVAGHQAESPLRFPVPVRLAPTAGAAGAPEERIDQGRVSVRPAPKGGGGSANDTVKVDGKTSQ